MHYSISGLCPRPTVAGASFIVRLFPGFRQMVADCRFNGQPIGQADIDEMVGRCGREWLDSCGFDDKMEDGSPVFLPREDLCVRWGEWGPEHISIPGNACGLDLDHCKTAWGRPPGGQVLLPHNMDGPMQALLALVVFCAVADMLAINESARETDNTDYTAKGKTMREHRRQLMQRDLDQWEGPAAGV